MWTWPDVVASLIGVAGLMWAIASSVKAGKAEKQAAAAAIQAATATTDAAAANSRAADALEKANELMAARMAPAPPPWALTLAQGNVWSLQNLTGHVVSDCWYTSIDQSFEEPVATYSLTQPEATIQIRAVKPFTVASITVHWLDATGNQSNYPITVRK
ncbi:MAG: hypothetical protein JWM55_604 [Acidimicrobiaceae bacterium]|nr:hypothetical protein [Acidimicrobiaceae bacterium]